MGKNKSLPIGIALTLLFGPFGLFYSLGRKKIKLTLVLIFIWALFLPIDGNLSVVIPMNLIPMVIVAGVTRHNRQFESEAEQAGQRTNEVGEAKKDNEKNRVGTLPHWKTRPTLPIGTPTVPDSLSPNMSGIRPEKRLTAPRHQFFTGRSNSTHSYSEPFLDAYTESDHSEALHEPDLGHDYDSQFHENDFDYDDHVPEGSEWRDPDDDPVSR